MKILFSVWGALALSGCSAECFRVLQSASYRPQRGYFKILLSPYYAILLAMFVFAVLCRALFDSAIVICSAYSVAAIVLNIVPRKSPLVCTGRIRRMFAVDLALIFAACFVTLCWPVVVLPFIALISWAFCLPFETLRNRRFLRMAHRKLLSSGVPVIAVTGSFGKTSAKDMLCALLDGAVAPKGSCNTPLGIAKYLNNDFPSNAGYLILEFGARKKGDIAELCRLYPPSYGLITGVCAQHLSTFRSTQNVRAAKRELAENLPADGVCLLCHDSVKDFAFVGSCRKIISPTVRVSDVLVSPDGLKFNASEENSHDVYKVSLPLITPHSVGTFAFCATLCSLLGQPFFVTVRNASKIAQVPHRLEISNNGRFYIIDDSYNANIRGVESCCDVVSHFDGVKVVISQGIAECGKFRRLLNFQCGKLLGEAFDFVIALGKNRKLLCGGAKSAGCNVLFAANLKQAVQLAQPMLSDGGFLVFQNDLPDSANI